MPAPVGRRRALVEPDHPHLSIYRQCELLGLNRSTYYLPPATESEENLRLMRLIDQQYLKTPFYGSRRMTVFLQRSGETVRGYPVTIPCNSRYLKGTGFLDVLGFKSLSIR